MNSDSIVLFSIKCTYFTAMNGEDDLPETSSTETKETDKKPHRKGGVGSARQRYKMGKS